MLYDITEKVSNKEWNTLSMVDKRRYAQEYERAMNRYDVRSKRIKRKLEYLKEEVGDIKNTVDRAKTNYLEATGGK